MERVSAQLSHTGQGDVLVFNAKESLAKPGSNLLKLHLCLASSLEGRMQTIANSACVNLSPTLQPSWIQGKISQHWSSYRIRIPDRRWCCLGWRSTLGPCHPYSSTRRSQFYHQFLRQGSGTRHFRTRLTSGIPMFTAALFAIAKVWKQPKCPTADEWIKKKYLYHIYGIYMGCVCVYTIYHAVYICGVLHTHTHTHDGMACSHKKEWNLDICDNMTTWMDLEGLMLSEVSQRKTNIVWSDM